MKQTTSKVRTPEAFKLLEKVPTTGCVAANCSGCDRQALSKEEPVKAETLETYTTRVTAATAAGNLKSLSLDKLLRMTKILDEISFPPRLFTRPVTGWMRCGFRCTWAP